MKECLRSWRETVPIRRKVYISVLLAPNAACFDKATISGERAYQCNAADMAEVLSQEKAT